MVICVDFDGTIVETRGRPYSDTTSPLLLLSDARRGLLALKRAGHKLVLYSARANRSLLVDPTMDPLYRAGVRKRWHQEWAKNKSIHQARYKQMIDFVNENLPGIFDAIDDGQQGKPMADLFIDDRSLQYGYGPTAMTWQTIAGIYGDPVYDSTDKDESEET